MTESELRDALGVLYANDTIYRDPETKDDELRNRCVNEIWNRCRRGQSEARLLFSRIIRKMWLSEDALALGYGIEDAMKFIKWLEDSMYLNIKGSR